MRVRIFIASQVSILNLEVSNKAKYDEMIMISEIYHKLNCGCEIK